MRLLINGQEVRDVQATTIAELVSELALRGRLAVEVNGQIVPRSRHAEHILHADDRVEIVRAVGGG
jgi:sulfur carrier protein